MPQPGDDNDTEVSDEDEVAPGEAAGSPDVAGAQEEPVVIIIDDPVPMEVHNHPENQWFPHIDPSSQEDTHSVITIEDSDEDDEVDFDEDGEIPNSPPPAYPEPEPMADELPDYEEEDEADEV
jgi:hypothetical protein